jgi:hypothetical protein
VEISIEIPVFQGGLSASDTEGATQVSVRESAEIDNSALQTVDRGFGATSLE